MLEFQHSFPYIDSSIDQSREEVTFLEPQKSRDEVAFLDANRNLNEEDINNLNNLSLPLPSKVMLNKVEIEAALKKVKHHKKSIGQHLS